MSQPNTKSRTISFFQIVRAKDEKPFPGINWQEQLRKLDGSAITHRVNEKDLRGEVFKPSLMRYLELDVARDTAPRQRDRTTNQRAPMLTNGETWEPIEEAFFAFFDNNIVGMVRSSQSAPSHAALAQWLNRSLDPAERYYTKQIVSRERFQRLSAMRGVSVATFGLRPQNVHEPRTGLIGAMLAATEHIGPDLRVELRVVASRSKGHEESRNLLAETLQINESIRSGDGGGLDRAIVNGIPEAGGPVEPINLIEQNLTMKRDIVVSEEEGKSLDEESAVSAIREAHDFLRDDLHAAIGIPLS